MCEMIKTEKKLYKAIILLILSFVLVVSVSIIRYPQGDINFVNSDATYHTLLTMQAYDETPASVHKFLPIVTLGNEADKNIPWGDAIPDSQGNYYYISFSSAGYVLPYLFCKMFFLPINELSLYIFNSILFAVSAFLVGVLVLKVFSDKKSKLFLSGIAIFLYVFNPETLISMGIVYWHQSIMQVTLLIQLIAFIDIYKFKKGKFSTIVFLTMCFLNPYIEWTGYVANVGYALAFLIIHRKDIESGIKKAMGIAGLTALSFMAFTVHFCSTLNIEKYIRTLGARFFARSFIAKYSYFDLLKGYLDSFCLLFFLIGLLFIVTTIIYKGFNWVKLGAFWSNKIVFAVAFFPFFENIFMKQHAIMYTFDRMKLIFIFLLIICDLMYLILEKLNYKAMLPVCLAVLIVGVSNYVIHPNERVWDASFKADNKLFADYCTEKYTDDNSVFCLEELNVRGYTNILFQRSIYEFLNYDQIIEKAEASGKRYAVCIAVEINPDNKFQWSTHKFLYIKVYDCLNKTESLIELENGVIVER